MILVGFFFFSLKRCVHVEREFNPRNTPSVSGPVSAETEDDV